MLSLNFFSILCFENFLLRAPVHALVLKAELQKHVSARLEWPVGVRDIWALAAVRLIASLVFFLVSQRDAALKFLKPPAVHPALIWYH